MEQNYFIKRANLMNERIAEVYRDAFREMTAIAKERKIVKINLSLHKDIGIDIPTLNWERKDNLMYYVDLESISFIDGYINLVSVEGDSAYMDKYWGDFFDVGSKFGQIYQAFMEIVGNDDLKPIELA